MRVEGQRLSIGKQRVNPRKPAGIRLALANVGSDYVHALRDRELLANLISIPWFRSAQFLGTYQGFAQSGDVSAVLRRRFYYPNDVRRPEPPQAPASGRPIHYDEAAADEPRAGGE
jgi:hypothetical protein